MLSHGSKCKPENEVDNFDNADETKAKTETNQSTGCPYKRCKVVLNIFLGQYVVRIFDVNLDMGNVFLSI